MTTTNLGELLKAKLNQASPVELALQRVEGLQTPEPVVQKYTLEEALPLLKTQHNLLTLKEAIELLENANSAWNEIRNCHVCRAILDQYYSGCVYQDRDFFDLDIEDFINSCNAITEDPEDVEVPDCLIEDWDLEQYFNDNPDVFWTMLDWGEHISKDDVREKYLENEGVDLDEYIEKFEI